MNDLQVLFRAILFGDDEIGSRIVLRTISDMFSKEFDVVNIYSLTVAKNKTIFRTKMLRV